ncbi:DUF4395 domain-containing protein [Tessaracoccus massiliensis]|uniref:DUF4395 domain-containing protein n=1 Tax=Tessaracoccus massiliensis TaxID=1522311 RepID=UPI00058FF084|nr:DUF4395 domain-containing protein [Tessaracoccus massiliensis]
MTQLFSFPNPVNEKAARVVAAGVLLMGLTVLFTGWQWLIPVMALGFLARVLAGPRFSALGQLATRVIAPRLGDPILVPGPPKRFAQGIGLAVTTVASVLGLGFGLTGAAAVLISVLVLFAFLEAAFAFCAGCWIFAQMMRAGFVPDDVCVACNNIWARERS